MTGRISISLPELAAEIVYLVEAAGIADFPKRQRCIAEQSASGLKPVLDQSVHWRTSQICIETTSCFTAADVRGTGNVIKGDRFGVVRVDIGQHLLDAYLGVDLYTRCFGFG